MTYLLFVLGFFLLLKGADFVVSGGKAIAERYHLSPMLIGLTIVAFGGSLPELVVSITGSFEGRSALVLGNVLGSNVTNILCILGLTACIQPLFVHKNTVWREIPLLLLSSVILLVLTADTTINSEGVNVITKSEGLVLLSFFLIFLYYIGTGARSHKQKEIRHVSLVKKHHLSYDFLLLGAGLLSLIIGSHWIIDGGVAIARWFGQSEGLIGFTIVATGTSLPELATSFVAAYRKEVDIAVGNIIGSNIFNLFFILGVSAYIHPLFIEQKEMINIYTVLGTSILLFIALFVGRKKHVLDRGQGILFFLTYLCILFYQFFRG